MELTGGTTFLSMKHVIIVMMFFAETADMVVGDAWLAQYIHDSQGNSVVITRNEDLERILSYAIKDGRLKLDILSEKDICRSQSGGNSASAKWPAISALS